MKRLAFLILEFLERLGFVHHGAFAATLLLALLVIAGIIAIVRLFCKRHPKGLAVGAVVFALVAIVWMDLPKLFWSTTPTIKVYTEPSAQAEFTVFPRDKFVGEVFADGCTDDFLEFLPGNKLFAEPNATVCYIPQKYFRSYSWRIG